MWMGPFGCKVTGYQSKKKSLQLYMIKQNFTSSQGKMKFVRTSVFKIKGERNRNGCDFFFLLLFWNLIHVHNCIGHF